MFPLPLSGTLSASHLPPPHHLQAQVQALWTAGASALPYSIPSWPPTRSGPPLSHFPDRETEAERSRVNCLKLPQDNNGADLAPSNAMLSTIVPLSLLHGRAVLSPSPQASPGCLSTRSAFVETPTKVRHTASHRPPRSFPEKTQRRDAANPLCSWGHCSPVCGPEPDGQQEAGQGREQWALWPRLGLAQGPYLPPAPRSQDWARRGAQHVQEGSALTVTLPSSSCSTPDPPTPPATAPSVPLVHSTNTDCTPTPLHTAPLPAPPRPQGRRKDALISWNRRSKRERATEGGQRQGPTGVHCCPTLGGLK